MQYGNERRTYRRSDGFQCEARISRDKIKWADADVFDLSSGGLAFRSDEAYDIGSTVWFDVSVTGFLTEIEFTARAAVRRKSGGSYGVSFEDLDHELKVHIDEAVGNFFPKGMLY